MRNDSGFLIGYKAVSLFGNPIIPSAIATEVASLSSSSLFL